MNIFDYVQKYGHLTFKEKEFNDIDNLVFCSLSYLNFTDTSININNHTIEYIGREFLSLYTFKEIKKLGIPQKNGYLLLQSVINTRRYKNIVVHDYVYTVDENKQFCAMMFRINKDTEYMCFEGTDETVVGWKEDFELSYKFPIPSQVSAIKYANKHIKMHGPNIIIGGHSKGGNLALVAAMYTRQYKQFRVKKVYSNDGPGLRKKEFMSGQYRRIKRKYTHIVPNNSMVGIILRNDIYNVVKSNRRGLLGHAIASWQIEDDHLVESKLSDSSIKLEQNIISWLENHTDKEKKYIVESVFGIFEEASVKKFIELDNLTNIKKVINNAKNIDKTTKDLLIDIFVNILDLKFLKKESN